MDLLKYAKVERERRWLLDGLPPFPDDARQVRIVDRYLHGTRLRLREVTETDGTVVRKLGHKVRLGDDAREVACTSLYLDDAEWAALERPPRRRPRRSSACSCRTASTPSPSTCSSAPYVGLFLAEIDAGDPPVAGPEALPERYRVVREVTDDESYTGAALARRAAGPA